MTRENKQLPQNEQGLNSTSTGQHRPLVHTILDRIDELQDFYDSSPVGYLTLDPEGRFLAVNLTASIILETPRAELIGESFYNYVVQEDRDILYLHLRRLFKNKKNQCCTLRIQNADNKLVHVFLESIYAEDRTGRHVCRSVMIDFTGQKRTEERLKLQANMLSQVSDAVIAVDTQQRVTYWNEAAALHYGTSTEEALGRPLSDLYSSRWIRPADEKAANMSLETTGRWRGENVHIRPDGQEIYVESTVSILTDEGGQRLGALAVIRDITGRKQMEKELRNSHDELEVRIKERTIELEKRANQLARLSSELTLAEQRERRCIAKILHDHLQQLLVGARINQEVLINEIDHTPKLTAERVLGLINQSIQEMRSLTAELAPPVLNSGDLSASLEWLVRWMYENQGLDVKLQSEVPIVLERKDLAVLLFQSIREILLNVLKHAGVKSAAVKIAHQNESLRVVISDQGVGFNVGSVWEDAESDQKFGLISIRERLQHLGGSLKVESMPNAGSTISLIVPLEDKKKTKKEARDLTRQTHGTSIPTMPGTLSFERKIHVMVVEDHPVMRQGLSRMLSLHSDIEVVGEASDGEDAVHLARELMPDVILMDISMPNMDGLDATRIIHREFPHIRIIGLSMYDTDEQAAPMIAAGAWGYCTKAGDTDIVLSAIRGQADRL